MLKLVAIAFLTLILCLTPVQGARTYIVDNNGFANYKNISEAVTAAKSGDTIYLKPGVYREQVVLDKALTVMPLVGETGSYTIDASGKETGLKLTADGCSVQGLTIENFTTSGIELASSGNTLKDNTIINRVPGGTQAGIITRNANKNIVSGTFIQGCLLGIFVWKDSRENQITRNSMTGCTRAVFLRDVGKNTLTENRARGCDYGIYLLNTSDVSIDTNGVIDCQYGIVLQNSNANQLKGCIISNVTRALGIGNGTGNQVEGLVITNTTEDGIDLITSDGNTLSGNKISRGDIGIQILDSGSNLLKGNQINGTIRGIYVEDQDRNSSQSYNNSIDESNLADGKPVGYFYSQSGKTIEGREFSHITLAYCKDMSVVRNTITKDAIFLFNSESNRIEENNASNCYGLRLYASNNNEVTGNIATNNSFSGILLVNSNKNQIKNNKADSNNRDGIKLFNSTLNTIAGNSMENNHEAGLWLNYSSKNSIYENNISSNPDGLLLQSSNENLIYHNNFINNKDHAEDRTGVNSWDMGNITGGNYWSGHKAFGNPSKGWSKLIKGAKIDSYPFQNPNGWKLPKEESQAPSQAVASPAEEKPSENSLVQLQETAAPDNAVMIHASDNTSPTSRASLPDNSSPTSRASLPDNSSPTSRAPLPDNSSPSVDVPTSEATSSGLSAAGAHLQQNTSGSSRSARELMENRSP
jgi:parallel beta-helix repeat protein